jgi:hypothetical protein
LAFLGTVANGAEVYRSTDENGVPVYSDRPDLNSERIYIATSRPNDTAASRPAAPAEPAATEPAAGTQQAANAAGEEAPQQTAEERAAERTKNCATARERQEKYATAHRLYRDLGDGQREYLTDGEIDEARNRATADVATWCG